MLPRLILSLWPQTTLPSLAPQSAGIAGNSQPTWSFYAVCPANQITTESWSVASLECSGMILAHCNLHLSGPKKLIPHSRIQSNSTCTMKATMICGSTARIRRSLPMPPSPFCFVDLPLSPRLECSDVIMGCCNLNLLGSADPPSSTS
ncbi:hypothetical protein AAY473_017419 [Plecturocebus cupreus]